MYVSKKSLFIGVSLLAVIVVGTGFMMLSSSDFEFADAAQVGVSDKSLNALVEDIQQNKFQQIHSLLVYKQGKVILEEYFSGNDDFIEFENDVKRNTSRPKKQWQMDDMHYVASINKAVTSMLTGIVLRNYAIDVDAPVYQFLPAEYQAYFTEEAYKALTFRHLLQMELGVEWDEWTGDDLKRLWKQDDFIPYLTAKNTVGPETRWAYNSASSNVLLTLLNTITGDIRAYAQQHFYSPLNIQSDDYVWEDQPTGVPEGAARLFLRPRDMLKIGVMLLQDGSWQEKRVVPEEWINRLYQDTAEHNEEYSHGFWLYEIAGHTYLSANGDGGQYINVFPEQDLVVVMTQGNYLEHPLYFDQAKEIMSQYLFD
ncbi:6-aminohexanoate-dimer hydrolase [Thalassocella blandensis]|nr:6-aminohexanoate-dimer hydrolase [Thalassocella blandensis]